MISNGWTCLDAYRQEPYTECLRQGSANDPLATGNGGSSRVLRGGAFVGETRFLRSTCRLRPRDGDVGFRCILATPRQP